MMQLRRGVTRTVLLVGKYAIKVPRLKDFKGHRVWSFCRAILANQCEYQWTGYEDAQVCPVLHSWLGGLINIYPRCREATEAEVEENYPKMIFKTPSDTKASNFGWYQGQFVWLDYDMNWNDCRNCNEIS